MSETLTNPNKSIRLFNDTYQLFNNSAEAAGGAVNHYYKIANRLICLSFAGPAMMPYIMPALDHLRISHSDTASLTICLWDSHSTGVSIFSPPWGKDDFAQHGEIPQYNTDSIFTLFQPGEDTLNLLDTEKNIGIFWRRDALDIPYYTVGAPLRSMFHWWMHTCGCQVLHAAAVGNIEGGALIVGKGGSGKSTTAVSCVHSDLLYLGDDYVLARPEPVPYVFSLYNTAKLDGDQIKRFPDLSPMIMNKEHLNKEKAVVFIHRYFQQKVCKGLPLKAIIVPQITSSTDTTYSQISKAEAITALAPSTLFQMPRNREDSFKLITDIVRQLPCYRLELGSDIKKIPDCINAILSQV